MKAIILLMFTAIFAAQNSASANNTPSTIHEEAAFIMSSNIDNWQDTIPVPATIRTTFNTRYPNASNVKWYRYTPDAMKVDASEWYSTLDQSDYYVSFNWEDADYVAWYDNGTWIRSSKRIDNTDLPDVVSRVLSTEYPGFIITDVDMEMDKGQTLYEVDLEKGNMKWNVHLTPAGAVIKKKDRSLTTAQVAETMVSDFQTRYPNASEITWYAYSPRERVEILPTDWDYGMDVKDYEVRFISDGTEYVAWYDNGNWLRSEVYTFDASKLPASINTAINTEFVGYTIKDVDREDNANQVLYEVELQKGNDKCKIHYATDGSVVKRKCRVAGVKTKS